MASSRTLRMLYLGFVAAVLSTLAFAGLLIPLQTEAVALAADGQPFAESRVPTSNAARIDLVLNKALASLQAKAAGQSTQLATAPASIELTAVEPAQPLARPSVRVAPEVPAAQVPSAQPVRSLVVPYDSAPHPAESADSTTLTIEERGQAGLALIDIDLAALGYTISFHAPNERYLGLAHTDIKHIEIFVRPELTAVDLAFVMGHEIGHAVDHIQNDRADRAAWRSLRGMDGSQPWWPTNSATDWGTPAGDFAECFGWWITGGASPLSPTNCAGTEALLEELTEAAN